MGKRFTDTELWDKEWFMKLSQGEKLAYLMIKAKCDYVGVWSPNYILAKTYIGGDIDWKALIEKCHDNLEILDDGKWFVTDFCDFQYGPLSKDCRPHKTYIRALEKHDLLYRVEVIEQGQTIRAKRSRVTQKVIKRIIARDVSICQYCGTVCDSANVVVDHFIPLSKGGDSEDTNLLLSCKSCNGLKSDLLPQKFIDKYNMTNKVSNRVLEFLDRVLRKPVTPKEKEQEKEQDKNKKKTKTKKEYASAVHMAPDEYDKLVELIGKDNTKRCIDRISAYKSSKGKTYKNDYQAIRLWAVEAVTGKPPADWEADKERKQEEERKHGEKKQDLRTREPIPDGARESLHLLTGSVGKPMEDKT